MSDHVSINRDFWNGIAADWVQAGQEAWASDVICWGNWRQPESTLNLLPLDMSAMAAVELGCATGYVSGWMARRGAKVTGVDVSVEQLSTARQLASQHQTDITFLERNAEQTGLPDASFDFAISEYGAAIWCDPELWLPEAHRILRPGATLVFLGAHPLTIITTPLNGAPCERQFHRPYRGLRGADWTQVEFDPAGIEFNRTISGWMALFAEVGFEVLHYHELFAPLDQTEDRFSTPAQWAKDYPSEQVWVLRRGP